MTGKRLNSASSPPLSVTEDPDRLHRNRAFSAARRHSRIVGILKIALPASGLILAVVAATPAVIPDIDIPGFSVKSIDLTDGKLTMEQPRLSGFTDKDRSYEVSARQAQQDVRNPKVISLDDIDAKVQFGATQWADLDATFGILDSDAETLVLERGITVRVNNGFEAFLKAAEIDLRAGRVESDQPVLVRKGNSTVRAQAMEIRDKGKTLLFRNGVTMTLVPDLEGGDAE